MLRPSKSNGKRCEAPRPVGLSTNEEFEPYIWDGPYPALPSPLLLSELALSPADFIELENNGDEDLDVSDYRVRVAPLFPGDPLPDEDAGELVAIPDQTVLEPGEKLVLPVDEDQLMGLSTDLISRESYPSSMSRVSPSIASISCVGPRGRAWRALLMRHSTRCFVRRRHPARRTSVLWLLRAM